MLFSKTISEARQIQNGYSQENISPQNTHKKVNISSDVVDCLFTCLLPFSFFFLSFFFFFFFPLCFSFFFPFCFSFFFSLFFPFLFSFFFSFFFFDVFPFSYIKKKKKRFVWWIWWSIVKTNKHVSSPIICKWTCIMIMLC